jgi:hypothetical protein
LPPISWGRFGGGGGDDDIGVISLTPAVVDKKRTGNDDDDDDKALIEHELQIIFLVLDRPCLVTNIV